MIHTQEELEIIDKYNNSIDEDIVEYVNKVYNGASPTPITVGFLTEKASQEIEFLTGKKVYGNRIILDSNDVIHIRNRHGKNGEQDESMANIEDIA